MTRLVIDAPHLTRQSAGVEVASTLSGAAIAQLHYRTAATAESALADPFLTACLLPAMAMHADAVEVRAPVSTTLLQHLPAVQDILSAWDSRMRRVAVVAEPAPTTPRARGVAAFFSGGVDSFYTVLRHRQELTHLVFVHGFDVSLRDHALHDRVAGALRCAAAELGLPLVEVATDVRQLGDRHLDWSERYHGSALASVAQLLGPEIGKLYLPASFGYDHLDPYGSHPLLDPLWSSGGVEIVHDGAGATRGRKVASIAEHDVAMRWLRVCWLNDGGAYNCGRCEKCVRTMTNLAIIGALARCRTFTAGLDLDAVRRVPLDDPAARKFVEENLAELERRHGDSALAGALRTSLRPHRARRMIHQVGRRLHAVTAPMPVDRGAISLRHFTFEGHDG